MIEIDEPKQIDNTPAQEQTRFKVIIFPHRKQSQPVEELTDEISEEIEKMKVFIGKINKHSYYKRKCIALSQCQVNGDNPLRYFIDQDYNVYFNPKIIDKNDPTTSKEMCLSYPFRQKKKVKRYFRIRVEYYNENMVRKTKDVEALKAAVFQHEIDHMNAKYIYD